MNSSGKGVYKEREVFKFFTRTPNLVLKLHQLLKLKVKIN